MKNAMRQCGLLPEILVRSGLERGACQTYDSETWAVEVVVDVVEDVREECPVQHQDEVVRRGRGRLDDELGRGSGKEEVRECGAR